MTAAPPPLTVQDLDREELLVLFAECLMFPLPQSKLWGARWSVLSRRALAARERELEAFSAYVAACRPLAADLGSRALSARLKDREAKRVAQEMADRAAKRVEAARDRAWKALEASYGRSAA